MTTEVLSPWLNGRIDLRAAYTFPRGTILAWLRDITEHPEMYGVPTEDVTDLLLIQQDILRLRHPDGPDYLVPPPPQSIARVNNPSWPNAGSPILIDRLTYDKVPYWALPDLLGLFMSKLGRSPAGANKRNFYLPLTAVYGMWCKKLIGEGVTPYVFQCTWNEEGDFFLGASRGAYSLHSERPWLAVVDRARFGVIKSEPLTLAGWSLARSPCIECRKKKDGTPFGRCAETYPFCKLLKTCGKGQAEKVYGLALSRPYLSSPHYDDRLSGPIWARLWKPCLNCKELIRIHGGKYENFLVDTGSEGAPP